MSNIKYEPGNLEKGIRFGCGGLFGIFIGVLAMLRGDYFESLIGNALFFIILTLFFGFLAYKKGDKFWLSIKNWL